MGKKTYVRVIINHKHKVKNLKTGEIFDYSKSTRKSVYKYKKTIQVEKKKEEPERKEAPKTFETAETKRLKARDRIRKYYDLDDYMNCPYGQYGVYTIHFRNEITDKHARCTNYDDGWQTVLKILGKYHLTENMVSIEFGLVPYSDYGKRPT